MQENPAAPVAKLADAADLKADLSYHRYEIGQPRAGVAEWQTQRT
jgi:hypothetical protein